MELRKLRIHSSLSASEIRNKLRELLKFSARVDGYPGTKFSTCRVLEVRSIRDTAILNLVLLFLVVLYYTSNLVLVCRLDYRYGNT